MRPLEALLRLGLARQPQPPKNGVRGNHRSPELFMFFLGHYTRLQFQRNWWRIRAVGSRRRSAQGGSGRGDYGPRTEFRTACTCFQSSFSGASARTANCVPVLSLSSAQYMRW